MSVARRLLARDLDASLGMGGEGNRIFARSYLDPGKALFDQVLHPVEINLFFQQRLDRYAASLGYDSVEEVLGVDVVV